MQSTQSYMIDPEIITKTDIEGYKKDFGLIEIPISDAGPYFLKNQLLHYSLDIIAEDIIALLHGNMTACLVTGFGVTGEFHLGNKLLLNEIKYLSSFNNEVHLFLSYADSLSKKVSANDVLSIERKLYSYINNKLGNGTIEIYRNYTSKDSDAYKNMSEIDFEKIFGEKYTQENYDAVLDTTASILNIKTTKRKVVLLGIDEIYNALFIKSVAEKLQCATPAFLFNELLIGYDGRKMGKTRKDYSLLVTGDPKVEIEKLDKYINTSVSDPSKCPACVINKYSEYEVKNIMHGTNCLEVVHRIIEQECSLS